MVLGLVLFSLKASMSSSVALLIQRYMVEKHFSMNSAMDLADIPFLVTCLTAHFFCPKSDLLSIISFLLLM